MIIAIIGALAAFGIMVFMHELGHFIFAKLSGVKVLTFAIGFGKEIFKFRIKETDYKICFIPLGGYVKMQGEYDFDEEKEKTPQKGDFMAASPLKRILIALAGPFFNIITAYFLMIIILMFYGESYYGTKKISYIYKDESYNNVNDWVLKSEDELLKLQGETINNFSDFNEKISKIKSGNITLEILRNGKIENITINIDSLKKYTILPAIEPIVGEVKLNSAASISGIKPGDKIISLNDYKINYWWDIPKYFNLTNETKYKLVYLRNGKIDSTTIIPQIHKELDISGKEIKRKLIGISINLDKRKLSFFEAAKNSFFDILNTIEFFFIILGKLFSGNASPKILGGPIQIFQIAGETARTGLINFINLIVLLSINLGILNLLPLPVMDGGQILFFIYEILFRKPVNAKARMILQSISVSLLLLLFIYVSFNDIFRIITK